MIGSVVNSRLASLHELETIYGLEGLFDLYEIILIKTANEQTQIEKAKQKRRGGRK